MVYSLIVTSMEEDGELGHADDYVDTGVSAGVHGSLLLPRIPGTQNTHSTFCYHTQKC